MAQQDSDRLAGSRTPWPHMHGSPARLWLVRTTSRCNGNKRLGGIGIVLDPHPSSFNTSRSAACLAGTAFTAIMD